MDKNWHIHQEPQSMKVWDTKKAVTELTEY